MQQIDLTLGGSLTSGITMASRVVSLSQGARDTNQLTRTSMKCGSTIRTGRGHPHICRDIDMANNAFLAIDMT
jgi:hypothetical protein